MDLDNLKEKSINQRKKQQITILAKEYSIKQTKYNLFKITIEDKPKVNLKHLAYYTLLWIAYIDNLYNIYLTLKKK